MAPKTDKSHRTVPRARQAMEAFSAHNGLQQAALVHKNSLGLVFRAKQRRTVVRLLVHHRFQPATRATGLAVIRFYDLLHSSASLLGAIVVLLVLSQTLGQSRIKLTADTYSHVFAPALRDAAAAMEVGLE